jgi:hypothetical protein
MGRVGAGGTIETEWENLTEPLFEIELPFPVSEDAIGFEIEGNSMWPRYDPHDVIVVSKAGEPLDGLLGFEAVVLQRARHARLAHRMGGWHHRPRSRLALATPQRESRENSDGEDEPRSDAARRAETLICTGCTSSSR